MKRSIPVVVRLYPDQVHKADLLKEVRIKRHGLTKQLREAPAKYTFWAAMYSAASKRVALLEERLEVLEARLYTRAPHGRRVSDIKYKIALDSNVRRLKAKLRHWKDHERDLKFAEKAMERRLYAMQSINANVRKEFEHEKSNEGDD